MATNLGPLETQPTPGVFHRLANSLKFSTSTETDNEKADASIDLDDASHLGIRGGAPSDPNETDSERARRKEARRRFCWRWAGRPLVMLAFCAIVGFACAIITLKNVDRKLEPINQTADELAASLRGVVRTCCPKTQGTSFKTSTTTGTTRVREATASKTLTNDSNGERGGSNQAISCSVGCMTSTITIPHGPVTEPTFEATINGTFIPITTMGRYRQRYAPRYHS